MQPQQQQQAQQQMQATAVNQQRSHSSIEPPKFNGTTQENGWYWLSKFIAYCRRAGVDITDDDAMLENFMLSIGGSAETWFMLLPHDQRDTFTHLQEAFRRRYDNTQNNYSDTDTFYSRKQQLNEPVSVYIDEMTNLGAKLHIGVNEIVATIKRGLLDHIRIQVMLTNTDTLQDLLQKATLMESFYLRSTQQPAQPHAYFSNDNTQDTQRSYNFNDLQQSANELKHLVGSLTQHLSRVNISSLTSQHRPNSRSPTPRRQHTQHVQCNATDKCVVGTTQDELMCTYCNSLGHVYENCRLREINTQQTCTPHDQQTRGRPMQRQFYASSHYTQPRASCYNAYGYPHPAQQQQQTNQYYNQRYQRYGSNNTQLHSSQNFE